MKAKVIPIKSRLYKINKVTKKRQRLSDNGFRDLGYVIRANDRSRYLSEKAQKIATNLHKMMQKHPEKKTFIDQAFLSNITKITTSGGNANIMWQLDDIFIRDYHDAVYFDGQKKRWGYIVSYTEDGEDRMNNPSKFYKMNSLFRPDENDVVGLNKLRPRSKKNTTHSIYKEIIEDIPYGYISSIIEESTTQESVRPSLVKCNETTPDAALPNLRGSSTGEFLAQTIKSQEPRPVDLAKSAKPRLVITASMQNGTVPIPSLPQASGLAKDETNTIATDISTPPPALPPVPPLVPPITPPTAMTSKQESDREQARQTRRQETVSDEPKPIGATIFSLIPRSVLEENEVTKTHQGGAEFQLTVEDSLSYGTLESLVTTEVEPELEVKPKTTNELMEEKMASVPAFGRVMQEAVNAAEVAYEHAIDKSELKLALCGLTAELDERAQLVTLYGNWLDISDLKKKHLKLFGEAFRKVLPDYEFKFIEEKK